MVGATLCAGSHHNRSPLSRRTEGGGGASTHRNKGGQNCERRATVEEESPAKLVGRVRVGDRGGGGGGG